MDTKRETVIRPTAKNILLGALNRVLLGKPQYGTFVVVALNEVDISHFDQEGDRITIEGKFGKIEIPRRMIHAVTYTVREEPSPKKVRSGLPGRLGAFRRKLTHMTRK